MLNGHRDSIGEGEQVFEMDGDVGHATMRMCLLPLNCHLQMVNFIMHISLLQLKSDFISLEEIIMFVIPCLFYFLF